MDKAAWSNAAADATLSSQSYRSDIDGLRAVAVCAVIAYHFRNELLPGGFLGVDMFFVISGHVITASLSKHSHSIGDLFLGFYCRRIKRLLPALLTCLIVTSLVGAVFIHPRLAEYKDSMKAGIYAIFGLSNIYFFKESSDYFANSAELNLFTHTWSLGVEEQFYLTFPLLFLLTGYASRAPRGRLLFFAAQGFLTIASFVLFVSLNRSFLNGAYFLMPPRAWELGLGSMTALALSSPVRVAGPARTLVPGVVPWLSVVVIATALFIPADLQLYSIPAIVTGTATLILTLQPGHLIYRFLTIRGVLVIGVLSYSLYLWHWSVLALARWTVGIDGWTAPFLLAAIAGLATSSYIFVERPLRRAQWSASDFVSAGYGLTAIAFTLGLFLILQKALSGVFYIGDPASTVAKGGSTLMDDKFYAGVLQWRPANCVLTSNDDVGKDIDADKCTLQGFENPAPRHFLVVGNSFSASEFEMYEALAERGLGSVIATSAWNASPAPELPNNSSRSRANDYYWTSVVPALTSHLGRGDFVIMINNLIELVPPPKTNAMSADRLALFKTVLQRIAGELRQKGIEIIFQSQNPLMEDSHCTPEMAKPKRFLDTSKRCHYYTKLQTIQRIQPLLAVLEEVKNAYPNFHVLDLFPVMCPGDVCRHYNDQNVFLYRDEYAHPSIEADYLARPVFLSVVNAAIASSQQR